MAMVPFTYIDSDGNAQTDYYDDGQAPAYDWSTINTGDRGFGTSPALGTPTVTDPNLMGPQPQPDRILYDPYSDVAGPQRGDTGQATTPDAAFNWNDITGSLKKMWDGLDKPTQQRLIGSLGGAGLAALTAPAGSKWLESTTNTYNAGAAPGFVNMGLKMNRTPVADRKGGNYFNTTYAAKGGVMPGGSHASRSGGLGHYLGGPTDGMADEIPATIDGKQPARLAHGEFVVPADVVSHLGNGNSDAGAKRLYDMMARIRKARTGNPKQGKQINPDKFMPKMAAGGIVSLNTGGLTPTANPNVVSTEQGVSNWAAPYVGDMLSKTVAATSAPYQAFQGPLTAGPSALQTQVSQGLQGIQMPANYGKSFTDTGVAQQYMNPYLQMSLDPQLAELRRQSGITQIGNDAKMTQAGAFGGDRQALLTGETQRNLQQQQALTTGNAYNTAFTNAMNQFNTEQGQGRDLLNQQANVGAVDQKLAQDAINAEKTAFEQERDNPYQMLKFQQSMLQGLPLTAQGTTTATPSILQQMAGGAAGGISLADIIAGRTGGTTTKQG